MDKLLKIYSKYYNIKPFCDGLWYELKCHKDNTTNECRKQKLRFYTDIPMALCETCNDGKLNLYKKICSTGQRYNLTTVTTRKEYFISSKVTMMCENAHTFTTEIPVKHCEDCLTEIIIKKRINKIKFPKPSVSVEGDKCFLQVPSSKQSDFISALQLVSNINSNHSFVLFISYFKNINIKKILGNLTINFLSEDKVSLAFHTEKPESNLVVIKKIDNVIEQEKQNDIINPPMENTKNINTKLSSEEIGNYFKTHNRFMYKNYCEIKNVFTIFYDEKYNVNDFVSNKPYYYKYEETDPVRDAIDKYIGNNDGKNVTEENVDHSSLLNIKPTRMYKILDKKIMTKCILDVTRFEDLDAVTKKYHLETKEEILAGKKIFSLICNLKKLIYEFSLTNKLDKTIFDKTINSLAKIKQEEDGNYAFEILLMEIFRSTEEHNGVDPVVINTIIFTVQDRKCQPFAVYYTEKNCNYTTNNGNLFIKMSENTLFWLPKRSAQKTLYVDTGVSELFMRILQRTNNFNYVTFCPYGMFGVDEEITVPRGMECKDISNCTIFVIDQTYNFADLLEKVIEEKSYRGRFLIGQLLIKMASCGCRDWFSDTTINFLRSHYRQFLSQDELYNVSRLTDPEKEFGKELENLFTREIPDPEKGSCFAT
nr:MAG: hypothetical protein DiTV3a_F5ORF3 [Diabrotica toursvirus 3a]